MKLDSRTLRLIAVGASVTANCQPCIQINITKALENGADVHEIEEAIGVGKMVRQGAATKMDEFTRDLMRPEPPASNPTQDECACQSQNIHS
jgi:AhpD family alkylhydroperoxidase